MFIYLRTDHNQIHLQCLLPHLRTISDYGILDNFISIKNERKQRYSQVRVGILVQAEVLTLNSIPLAGDNSHGHGSDP